MLTRKKVRYAACWMGLCVGAIGGFIYLLSPLLFVGVEGPFRSVQLGRGAIRIGWHQKQIEGYIPIPGAAPTPTDPMSGLPVGGQPGQHFTPINGQYFPAIPKLRDREWTAGRPESDQVWQWLPRLSQPNTSRGALVLPAWLFVLIGLVCLYLRLPSEARPGFCSKCDFDLRNTPALEKTPGCVRCPECGTIARKHAPSAQPAQNNST